MTRDLSSHPSGASQLRSLPRPPVRVAITQPYVPAYRVALWERVLANLAEAGVEGRVFYGGDRKQRAVQDSRGDGVQPPWATRVTTRTLRPPRRLPVLTYRRLPKGWRRRSVLLVTEMQASNSNAWLALLRRQRFVSLGHGLSQTTDHRGLASTMENRLNASASHVLTYTEGGRAHVVTAARVVPSRVTSFGNTIDTTRLGNALEAATADQQSAFLNQHNMPPGAKIALFLGALNKHKNIDLLVSAARVVFRADSSRWLVVAGEGDESRKLEELADSTGRVVLLGQVPPEEYAAVATMADILLNPGRVGLVAIDALVMGVPILSTTASARAPEYEYLRPGIDILEVDTDPELYARAWLEATRPTNGQSKDIPTIDKAALTISSVILKQLHADGMN